MHHFHSSGLDDATTLASRMMLCLDPVLGGNSLVQGSFKHSLDGGIVSTVGTKD